MYGAYLSCVVVKLQRLDQSAVCLLCSTRKFYFFYLIHRLFFAIYPFFAIYFIGSRVVSVLDSGAVGPGFKSHPRRCRVTVLGKLFTPIVLLFTKQRNW